MNALSPDDGNITHRREIIQLLNMAIMQEYRFSQISMVKSQVSSNPIKLLSVNAEEGTFSMDSERVIPEQKSKDSMMFRARCGGLSIAFKSRMAELASSEPSCDRPYRYKIELPYSISCIQLRNSVRVDLKSLSDEVPALLCLSKGGHIDGKVIDISTSGAKIRVNRNLAKEFNDYRALEACRINLPDNFVLQTGAQLIGMKFDRKSGTSTLGCQFVNMQSADENMLEQLVNSVLKQTQPMELAIAS